ncbi:AmmeMemoRadiSam system protein A [Candidatus Pacearchaeota archaeon]|nr:AmmeMemoRadiSam system protein A [Candidatus Pacearchaeota archaeon]
MKELLKLARETIKAYLTGEVYEADPTLIEEFGEAGASFVTLTLDGELRGCVGSLSARQPLYTDVAENAMNAAFHDTRFGPVVLDELDNIKIEVSVLSSPEKLGKGEEVFDKIESDMGLILKRGFKSATFLPQVWKQIPDKTEFLEHLSVKAGLGQSDWKGADLEFYKVESVEE